MTAGRSVPGRRSISSPIHHQPSHSAHSQTRTVERHTPDATRRRGAADQSRAAEGSLSFPASPLPLAELCGMEQKGTHVARHMGDMIHQKPRDNVKRDVASSVRLEQESEKRVTRRRRDWYFHRATTVP